MSTGIYKISNKITNKVYIGSAAISFSKRWALHRHELRKNKHKNNKLQNAYNKYGEDSFEFSIIKQCLPEDCLKEEQSFIDTINPFYNICKIAGSPIGVKRTLAQIEQNRRRQIGKTLSKETKIKISLANKGRPAHNKGVAQSIELIEKRRAAMKGKCRNQEVRDKISAGKKGCKSSMQGKKHSEDSKNRIKESNYLFSYLIQTPSGEVVSTCSVSGFSKLNKLNPTHLMNTYTKSNLHQCHKGYSIKSKQRIVNRHNHNNR